MGPTKLNMEEKSMVMALVGEGLSNREIGRKLKRSEAAVRRVKKAAAVLGTGAAPQRKKGSGRKRKTHPRTDKLLESEVIKDPFISAKELKEAHADVLGEVSVRTMQDRLQKHLKLSCRRAARRPRPTEKKAYDNSMPSTSAASRAGTSSTSTSMPGPSLVQRKSAPEGLVSAVDPVGGTTSSGQPSANYSDIPAVYIECQEEDEGGELLCDEDMDLKVEIKEEVVDDTPEFLTMIDYQAETLKKTKEDTMDVGAMAEPSISGVSTSISHEKVLPVTPRVENGDEFHLFGMFVASQLRAMPLRDALQAQLEIQTILAQKRSQKLT